MTDTKSISVHDIEKIVTDKEKTQLACKYLGNSLFYYCSGKDPTPVVAFGSRFPLYIYVDIDSTEIEQTVDTLDKRISSYGFKICEKRILRKNKNHGNCIITKWKDQNENIFFLVYFREDAAKCCYRVYEYETNYIQPKCICNVRENLGYPQIIATMEKRVEYIMGYCFSNKYSVEATYPYLGDYGDDKVNLFHRDFYLVY